MSFFRRLNFRSKLVFFAILSVSRMPIFVHNFGFFFFAICQIASDFIMPFRASDEIQFNLQLGKFKAPPPFVKIFDIIEEIVSSSLDSK